MRNIGVLFVICISLLLGFASEAEAQVPATLFVKNALDQNLRSTTINSSFEVKQIVAKDLYYQLSALQRTSDILKMTIAKLVYYRVAYRDGYSELFLLANPNGTIPLISVGEVIAPTTIAPAGSESSKTHRSGYYEVTEIGRWVWAEQSFCTGNCQFIHGNWGWVTDGFVIEYFPPPNDGSYEN